MSKKIIAFDTEQDTLLSALTTDVVKLKKQAAERYRFGTDWFAINVCDIGERFEVLLKQRRENGVSATTRFGETETSTDLRSQRALPNLYKALKNDLLTVSALVDALNHADTDKQVRKQLAMGVRTHQSKVAGFRWDMSYRYNENFGHILIDEDIKNLASEYLESFGAHEQVFVRADYETLWLSAKFTREIAIPFHDYPFLARAAVETVERSNLHELGRDVARMFNELQEVLDDMVSEEQADVAADIKKFASEYIEQLGTPDRVLVRADRDTLWATAKFKPEVSIPFFHYPSLTHAVVNAADSIDIQDLGLDIARQLKRRQEFLDELAVFGA